MKDIFCQDGAVAALQRAVASGHVAGSYIFAGLEGVGKFTAAREWGRILLCEQNTRKETGERRKEEEGAKSKKAKGRRQEALAEEACGECESCKAFEGGEHPDFHHVYKELLEFTKDGKGRTTPVALPIDVIREFLIEKVAQTPVVSRQKVFVVSEAEKLLLPAQNAMLKTLEEPPADTHIILLCTRLDKLLPTTLSRCQIVKFGPISEERIIEKLGQRGVDEVRARYWARFTDGSLGRAMWWSGLQLGEQDCYAAKRQLVSRVANLELADSVDLAQWMADTGKAVVDAWEDEAGDQKINRSDIGRAVSRGLIYMVATVFADAMKMGKSEIRNPKSETKEAKPQSSNLKTGEEGNAIVNVDQREEIGKVAERFDAEGCAEVVVEAYKAMNWIETNVNEKLVLEDLLLGIGGCGTMSR